MVTVIPTIILLAIHSWSAQARCPFASLRTRSFETEADIIEVLKERFNHSLYSKGEDLETRLRDDPTKKNLFGHCPSETCRPDYKYRSS